MAAGGHRCYIYGMTILKKFVAFAETLSAEERREVESLLASIMYGRSVEFELTAEEEAELDRRMAEPDPEYAGPEEIEAIFRRYREA